MQGGEDGALPRGTTCNGDGVAIIRQSPAGVDVSRRRLRYNVACRT